MLALTLVLCAASGGIGQTKVPAPSPDRLVKVRTSDEMLPLTVPEPYRFVKRTDLLIDRISFGVQYPKPDLDAQGHPDKDFSRFPGCYFHPAGPAGIALERFNWFRGRPNTYASDARLPAALVGQLTLDAAYGHAYVAAGGLTTLWSEPPIAVLGMDAGNLAGYARPYQAFHFVERISRVFELSLPAQGADPKFTFVSDARQRGACIEVDQGEFRATLEKKKIRGFYHLMFIQPHKDGELTVHKELFTKEGMALCMDALVPDGILCYHTSSRYFEFPKLIADCADALGYAVRRGHDTANYRADGRQQEIGHWTSEWVMVARKPAHLKHLRTPPGYKSQSGEPYWSTPEVPGRHVWTDAGPKSMRGMVRSDPAIGSMASGLWEFQEVLTNLGVSPKKATELIQPVQGMLNSWGQLVARGRDY